MDLKSVLMEIAPTIGSAIGGPLGGRLVATLERLFTGTGGLADRIQSDPDAKVKLTALHVQLAMSDNLDIENARQTELVRQHFHWMVPVVGIFVCFGFLACIFVILFTPMDKSDHDILSMCLGSLGTCFVSVVVYYFGSTHPTVKN